MQFIFAHMYRVVRKIFFLMPAETAHYAAMNLLRAVSSIGVIKKWMTKYFECRWPEPIQAFGLSFKNPVGLGAGFDKNANFLNELELLGFGFVEIGTVTPKPQAGNDKPRLFRLVKDKALINRMGFNNDGAAVIAGRLKKWREKDQKAKVKSQNKGLHEASFLIGGNIGKNKSTANEEAWKDYEICFKALHPYVDFFVVNVSSPNTPGLRELQEKEALKKILTHLQSLNQTFESTKPLLLKIAPDLSWQQIDDVIDLAKEIQLDGLVATNTTINRKQLLTGAGKVQAMGAGGVSGQPVQQRATEIVQYIHQKTNGAIALIGSGGIFTATDAQEKIAAGASLIEVWTGFIYEGPAIAKRICKGLA